MRELPTIVTISEYVKDLTNVKEQLDISEFTAQSICKNLHLSRTLVSQYLNVLHKENQVIKIVTRPVYFFSRSALEQKYRISLKHNEYDSLEELEKELGKGKSPEDFEKAIGYYGSLYECFRQIKSAICYPPNGLPLILHGEMGVGKSYIVSLTFEFLKNKELIKPNSTLEKINITKNSNLDYEELLFGSDSKVGLLYKEECGLLYIKNSDLLSDSAQLKLAKFLSNDIKKIIILSTSDLDALQEELLLKIPIVCHVLNFDRRFEDEREQLVYKLFQAERSKLHRELYVSKKVIDLLKNHSYEHNINGLQKVIKNLCALKYSNSITNEDEKEQIFHPKSLTINTVDLPAEILNHYNLSESKEELIDVSNMDLFARKSELITLFENLITLYSKTKSNNTIAIFLEHSHDLIRNFYEFINFDPQMQNEKIKALEHLMFELIKKMRSDFNITFPVHFSNVLARLVYLSSFTNSAIKRFDLEHAKHIESLNLYLSQIMKNEYAIASRLMNRIVSNFEIALSDIIKSFIVLNLNYYNAQMKGKDTVGIIIAHGYSTASSIADAVNTLLNVRLFEAIDMPLNTSTQDILEKINDFLSFNPYYTNIVIMVDMGSLEDIGSRLNAQANIGIINNISTSMALRIGESILANEQMNVYLQEVCEHSKSRYTLIQNENKESAIVFTNDVGMDVSEKIARLFKNLLKREIDLKFIEYDYHQLMKNKKEDVLFKRYHVVLLVKPHTLNIEGVSQVSLEDILSYKDIDKVNHALKPFLSEVEIEQFNSELLKNFSLISVMKHLTILNANVLMEQVSDSLNALQKKISRRLKSNTLVGMYIHICMLIERLVTKNISDQEIDTSKFEKEQGAFIELIQHSFENLLKNYNVSLPIFEIMYLYDYIKNDEEMETRGGEM